MRVSCRCTQSGSTMLRTGGAAQRSPARAAIPSARTHALVSRKGDSPPFSATATATMLRQSNSPLKSRHASRLQPPAAGPPGGQMLIYVPSHPLSKHWLAVARNKLSPPPVFRSALAELGRILLYEAVDGWLPTVEGRVETPTGVADCTFVDPSQPLVVVPILRAGLVLLESASTLLPASRTYHVGYARDEGTLQASAYLNKLPARLSAEDRVLVVDVMLATGGTVVQVVEDLVSRGASDANIRVVAAVCAPPALQALGERFGKLRVYAGMIDAELDERGYIVPGLGDAGDRAFGTE